jgi:gliding motility-associated-like protein
MKKYNTRFFLLFLFSFFCISYSFGQTLMPLPPHVTNYSSTGHIRGYWFTAPTNFTITGLRVPPEAGTGVQTLYVITINDPVPVVWATVSTNITQLYGATGLPNGTIVPVSIPITTGTKVGILGYAGGIHSYGTTAPLSNIDGLPVTLNRMGTQVLTTPGMPFPNYWTENASIARVEMYYNACTVQDTNIVSICDNRTYKVGTNEYTTSGTYIDSFKMGSCDSIVYTFLTVNPTYNPVIVDSFYEGGSYTYNNSTYYSTGNYKHAFSSVDGCDSIITLSLKSISFTVHNIDTIICKGDGFPFLNKVYETPGLIYDTFVSNGRHDILILNLTVRNQPVLNITLQDKDFDNLCAGEPITLIASGAEEYRWLHRSGDPLDKILYRGAVFNTDVYAIKTPMALWGVDEIGCYSRIEFDLLGQNCCELFIPSAFSPNGDGLNDVFEVKGRQPLTYLINIYNRQGNLVFTSRNVGDTWDGSHNGQPAASDVYFYLVQGECYDGTIINQKGDITIIR